MHATRQAGIKAAYCTHDVDAFEFIRAVLFEDGCVLHRIFVWARCTIDISHTGIPGRRRIGMVVGDLPVLDDHVVRKHTTHSFVEAAADGLLWHREITPRLRVACAYLGKRFIYKMESHSSGVGLEVGTRAVPLDRVAPLRDLPLKLHLWLGGALGQANLHTCAGSLDIATQVHDSSQGRHPQTSQGTTASI